MMIFDFKGRFPPFLWDVFIRLFFFIVLGFQAYQIHLMKDLLLENAKSDILFEERHIREIVSLSESTNNLYIDALRDIHKRNVDVDELLAFRSIILRDSHDHNERLQKIERRLGL